MRDPAAAPRNDPKPRLALGAIATGPLRAQRTLTPAASAACRQRPTCSTTRWAQSRRPIQTERRVSVQLHPVSSLGLRCLAALSLQGGPARPTYSGTTPTHTIRPANRVAVLLVVLRDHLVAVEQHRPNHARVSHKGPEREVPLPR